jgi:GT2 family glycosyltransferase/SAM-dependent methyltransferase
MPGVLPQRIGTKIGQADTILDAGCGAGKFSQSLFQMSYLKNVSLVGLDIHLPSLRVAKDLGLYEEVVRASAHKIPFKERTFDVVLCVEVLEHLPRRNGSGLLEEIERVASKRVVLSTPNGFSPRAKNELKGLENPFMDHVSGWLPQDFKEAGYDIEGNGLAIIWGRGGLVRRLPRFLHPLVAAVSYLMNPIASRNPILAAGLICRKNIGLEGLAREKSHTASIGFPSQLTSPAPASGTTADENWPLVSVVVSNYNGVKFGVLEKCLSSLDQMTYPRFETLIVDNSSDDDSPEYVLAHFKNPRLTIVRNSNNNYTQGLNIALENAKADYILYLNNDTEATPDLIKPLVLCMKSQSNAAIVQCKLLQTQDRTKIDSLGEAVDFLGYHTSLGAGKVDFAKECIPFEVPCTNGSAFMIRKSLLLKVRGFDPQYCSGYEDVDLSLRMRALGYSIFTAPQSVIYHARGTTALSEQMRTMVTYHFSKNRLVTLLKFHSSRHLFLVLPMLTAAYFLEFLWVGVRGRSFGRGFAKLRGMFWVVKNIRYVLSAREQVRKMRKTNNVGIIFGKPLLVPGTILSAR